MQSGSLHPPEDRRIRNREIGNYKSAALACGVFPAPVAKRLDLLRLSFIESYQVVMRFSIRPKQFIQLGVNGLGVAVFGALDEQRHEQGRKRRGAVPIQARAIENEPEDRVEDHRPDSPWSG